MISDHLRACQRALRFSLVAVAGSFHEGRTNTLFHHRGERTRIEDGNRRLASPKSQAAGYGSGRPGRRQLEKFSPMNPSHRVPPWWGSGDSGHLVPPFVLCFFLFCLSWCVLHLTHGRPAAAPFTCIFSGVPIVSPFGIPTAFSF